NFYFQTTMTSTFSPLYLHDALPIFLHSILFLIEFYPKTMHCKKQEYSPTSALGLFQFSPLFHLPHFPVLNKNVYAVHLLIVSQRSEEHTSELQSRFDILCRILLEKK